MGFESLSPRVVVAFTCATKCCLRVHFDKLNITPQSTEYCKSVADKKNKRRLRLSKPTFTPPPTHDYISPINPGTYSSKIQL